MRIFSWPSLWQMCSAFLDTLSAYFSQMRFSVCAMCFLERLVSSSVCCQYRMCYRAPKCRPVWIMPVRASISLTSCTHCTERNSVDRGTVLRSAQFCAPRLRAYLLLGEGAGIVAGFLAQCKLRGSLPESLVVYSFVHVRLCKYPQVVDD